MNTSNYTSGNPLCFFCRLNGTYNVISHRMEASVGLGLRGIPGLMAHLSSPEVPFFLAPRSERLSAIITHKPWRPVQAKSVSFSLFHLQRNRRQFFVRNWCPAGLQLRQVFFWAVTRHYGNHSNLQLSRSTRTVNTWA